ncbi:hypothetical protein GCM10023165_05040 [Variovorax defluvii]|uniref:Uncharacterized protein n=1 Tax=Variovorax defluvii TaxID=913761 RepID=A0ABP8GXJ8_9BURK
MRAVPLSPCHFGHKKSPLFEGPLLAALRHAAKEIRIDPLPEAGPGPARDRGLAAILTASMARTILPCL